MYNINTLHSTINFVMVYLAFVNLEICNNFPYDQTLNANTADKLMIFHYQIKYIIIGHVHVLYKTMFFYEENHRIFHYSVMCMELCEIFDKHMKIRFDLV